MLKSIIYHNYDLKSCKNQLANPVHIVVGDDGKRGNIVLRALDPPKQSQVTTAVIAENEGWIFVTVADLQGSKSHTGSCGDSGGKEGSLKWTNPTSTGPDDPWGAVENHEAAKK